MTTKVAIVEIEVYRVVWMLDNEHITIYVSSATTIIFNTQAKKQRKRQTAV
jgi:hypothetical protein